MTTYACQIFLGVLFLTAAYGKAKNLQLFQEHLEQYKNFKKNSVNLATSTILFQAILGFTLITGFYVSITFAISFISIILMSIITLYGIKRYNIKDCACYGNLIRVTPKQSLKLNISFLMINIIGLLDSLGLLK